MDLIQSTPTHPALKTMGSFRCEVVPGREWACPPGGDQAQPTCFGLSQLRIPERSENDRLCSTCTSLGHLNSRHWEGINDFREVIVQHHHSFNALLKSAREGCHLCGLLLIAWEEKCQWEKEYGDEGVGKAGLGSASLNDGVRLKFQRKRMENEQRGLVFDEVQITILCGDLPCGMGGRLICQAMNSEYP